MCDSHKYISCKTIRDVFQITDAFSLEKGLFYSLLAWMQNYCKVQGMRFQFKMEKRVYLIPTSLV